MSSAGISPDRRFWAGAAAIVVAGSIWAALCAALASGGHAPSVTLLPIPEDHYYAFQAAVVVPTLLGCWTLCAFIGHRLARVFGGNGNWRLTAGGIAFGLAVPLLVLFLLPDVLAYAIGGFSALAKVFRITAPLSFVVSVVACASVIRRQHQLGLRHAFIAAFAGVFIQALVGGIILR